MAKKIKPEKTNSSGSSGPVDFNLVKSGLRGVFKNKIQLIAFFCLFFFTAILASGFSGFSSFLKDQNAALSPTTNINFPDVVVETTSLGSTSMPNYLDSYGGLAYCSADDSNNEKTVDHGYEFANCKGGDTKYRMNYDSSQGSNFVDFAVAMEKAVRDKYQDKLKNQNDFPITFSLVNRKSVLDKDFTYESYPINMMLPQYNQNIMEQFPNDTPQNKLKRDYWSNMWSGMQNYVTSVAQFESKDASKVREFNSGYDFVDIQKLFDNTGSPILVEGDLPISKFEIGINPYFAKEHNIGLGDNWTIAGLTYKVVGYFTTSEFMYPQFSYSNLTPSNLSQTQVFFPDNYYNAAFGNYFATITFADIKPTFYIRIANEYRNIISANDLVSLLKSNPTVVRKAEGTKSIFGTDLDQALTDISKIDDGNFAQRTTFLGSIVDIMNKLFLGVIILVAFVIIIVSFVVIKKMIEDEGKEVGVLKSLGHSNTQIAFMYVAVPLVISMVACLLGIFTGSLFWTIGIDLLNRYFNFSIVSAYSASVYWSIFGNNLLPILGSLLLPIVFSGVTSYGISSILLLKSPVRLLKRG